MSAKVTRKLTTILAADAESFSTAMNTDEVGTCAELNAARDVFNKLIDRHGGRIANTAGDGLIAEFPSVVEAVQCAIESQQELSVRKEGLKFRIGVHLGDVIVDGQDLIGEGVNLAARLQTMAEPGGVLISQQVYDQVHAKLSIGFEYLGERRPRNLTEDVAVYRVSTGTSKKTETKRRKPKPTTSAKRNTSSVTSEPGAPSSITRDMRVGLLCAGALLVIDLLSGSGFWAHWPILVIAVLAGLRRPNTLAAWSSLSPMAIRVIILSAGLIMINLFSWEGNFWAIWPIGVSLALLLGYRAMSRTG